MREQSYEDQNEFQRLPHARIGMFGMPPLQRVLDHAGHVRLIEEAHVAIAQMQAHMQLGADHGTMRHQIAHALGLY